MDNGMNIDAILLFGTSQNRQEAFLPPNEERPWAFYKFVNLRPFICPFSD